MNWLCLVPAQIMLICVNISQLLFGVGARLDTDSLLFFTLRGVDFKDLLAKSLEEKVQAMVKNSKCKTSRIIDENSIAELFGIDF